MEQHEIKINLPGLLRMLGYNIYAEPEASVREMIQNAHDTCIIRKTKDKGFTDPRIHISYDKAQKTLTFADNGAGMTEEELHEYLSTIGRGFTELQKKDLREMGVQEALLLIGQFGIGLLSAFSVAEKVEIFTRSYQPDSPGFRWICEGDIHYTMEPAEVPEPGTRVVLHLSDSSLVLLDDTRLRQAIKKYADFLSVPIFLKGNQINVCTPPWEEGVSEMEYTDYIHARYNLYPLDMIPFKSPDPPHIDGLLFVPMIPFELARDFGEVDVYISRMFVKAGDKELLPAWARFVKGVINSPALTPTVSRDELVRDENYHFIRALLGEIILKRLAYLQEQDPRKLDLVVGAYNNTIKARSLEDDEFFDRICDLVRVSTSSGHMSMKEYLVKSEGVIYYFSERGTATQHKLLFAHKGLPVIDASWGMEEEFLEKYAERKGVKLERLEADSGIIFKVPETVDEKWQALERQFKLQVHKEARAVAFEPSTVPAVLVAKPIERGDKQLAQVEAMGQELGFSSDQIRQMFQQLAQGKIERAAGEDTILHLNTTNPLMQQLRDMNRNETFHLALTAIYNNAMMFAHHYVSPENAEVIFATNNAAISAMIRNVRALEEVQGANARMEIELGELKRKMPQVRLSEHRSCFFAFDYNIEENYELMEQLQQYFLERGFGIEVIAPVKGMHDLNILKSMYDQLHMVHFGLAEITGNNPNVFYEAGLLKGLGKPVILLKKKGAEGKVPFDVFSDYRIEYELTKRAGQVKFVWLEEEMDRVMQAVFKMLPRLERAAKWKSEK
jgi:molecular chaperone HtpG